MDLRCLATLRLSIQHIEVFGLVLAEGIIAEAIDFDQYKNEYFRVYRLPLYNRPIGLNKRTSIVQFMVLGSIFFFLSFAARYIEVRFVM